MYYTILLGDYTDVPFFILFHTQGKLCFMIEFYFNKTINTQIKLKVHVDLMEV